MARHSSAYQGFVDCAIAIVDELGVDGLVMRELAHRTHYSVSTVSYHVTPWSTFLTQVWSAAREAFVAEVVPPPPIDQRWFHTMAEATVAWAQAHPLLAQFLISHFPRPEVELHRPPTIEAICREMGLDDVPADRVTAQVVIRQAQSLVEAAIHVGGADGVRLLAEQLHHQYGHWRELALTVAARDRTTPIG